MPCLQAIKLIPIDVWQRAKQRADEEPLRLSKCWPAACCIFVLWNVSAVGLAYLLCKRLGNRWWSRHWWVAAVSVASSMSLAEAAWALHMLFIEKRARAQADKVIPDDVGINAPLVCDEPHSI